nr:MAG TPA: hypothetical protein [Caudoviricetes sp.]
MVLTGRKKKGYNDHNKEKENTIYLCNRFLVVSNV